MTMVMALAEWRQHIKPHLPPDDAPAHRESWVVFVDHLVREGRVPEHRAARWGQPPENR